MRLINTKCQKIPKEYLGVGQNLKKVSSMLRFWLHFNFQETTNSAKDFSFLSSVKN